MLTAVLLIVVACLLVSAAARFIQEFKRAEGSSWKRVLAASKSSATIFWNYIVIAAGTLLAWADQAAQFFNFPEVQAFLKDHLTPTRVGIAMTGIAIITIIARLRSIWASR